jgi:hypothetical protein
MLARLPDDLIVQIFQFSSTHELLQLSLTALRYHQILNSQSSNVTIWKIHALNEALQNVNIEANGSLIEKIKHTVNVKMIRLLLDRSRVNQSQCLELQEYQVLLVSLLVFGTRIPGLRKGNRIEFPQWTFTLPPWKMTFLHNRKGEDVYKENGSDTLLSHMIRTTAILISNQ